MKARERLDDAAEAVILRRQRRIIAGAEARVGRPPDGGNSGIRFDVLLVAPKSLPCTSSGKLSRAGAKDGYLASEISEISPLARVPHRPSGEARLHAAE